MLFFFVAPCLLLGCFASRAVLWQGQGERIIAHEIAFAVYVDDSVGGGDAL